MKVGTSNLVQQQMTAYTNNESHISLDEGAVTKFWNFEIIYLFIYLFIYCQHQCDDDM